MKFSSQLKFQHTPNQEVPDHTPSIPQWSPGLLLLLPSVIHAGHPQFHLHMAHTDPWNLPLQTQAQVDPQHGHTNYIFVLLTDAMKVKGKMANSGSCWKHHYFLLWPRVFWTLNIWILKQGLYSCFSAATFLYSVSDKAYCVGHSLLFQRWKFICWQYQQISVMEFKRFLKHSYHLSAMKDTNFHSFKGAAACKKWWIGSRQSFASAV